MKLGPFTLIVSNEQHMGARQRQEDYFGFWSDETDSGSVALAVVADGMGGHAGGDAASVAAVTTFVQSFQASSLPNEERLVEAARQANRTVYALAAETQADLGCTLVALLLCQGTYQWLSVGDSVVYRYRDTQLRRLNRDHNLGTQLDDQLAHGDITAEYAQSRSKEREYLTSNLGLVDIPEIDLSQVCALAAGDFFLLASDGLCNTLDNNQITDVLSQVAPRDAASALVQAVLDEATPQQDNVTALCLHLADGETS